MLARMFFFWGTEYQYFIKIMILESLSCVSLRLLDE